MQGSFVNVIISSKFYVHIPVVVIGEFLMSYGVLCIVYESSGIDNQLKYVIKNQMGLIITMTWQQLLAVYFLGFCITYMKNKNKMLLTQVQISKLSMKVLINSLDDAIFLKSDDGQLCYCNDLAGRIID